MAFIAAGDSGKTRANNHDLPLVPFIDFLLCLIAFLLVTAVWTQAARMEASANAPASGVDPNTLSPELHVTVGSEAFDLAWRQGGTLIDTARVARRAELSDDGSPRYPELGKAVSDQWQARGVHRTITDVSRDRAVLHTKNDLSYAEMVGVMDAIETPSKSGDSKQPAFAVTLAVD